MTEQSPQMRPKVSVIMTIYNAGPYLKEAIDSIVTQTFDDWELIAVENGSSDESPAILATYTDERVRAFSLPKNIGRTPALRYAFEQAQGQYIAVLDADDVSYPERLKKQAEYLDQNLKVGLVGSWADQINEHSKMVGEYRPATENQELNDSLGWSNPFVHSSIMYRADLARQTDGYPENYAYAQDYALILNIAKKGPVALLAEPLCRWRILKTSITRSPENAMAVAREGFLLLQIADQNPSFSKSSLKRKQLRQAVSQLKYGYFLIKNENLLAGLRLAIGAIIKKPSCLVFNGPIIRLIRSIKSAARASKTT